MQGMKTGLQLLVVAACAMTAAACSGEDKEREDVTAAMRTVLEARTRPAYVTADAEGRRLWTLTRKFYERRSMTPAWVQGNDPKGHVAELTRALAEGRDQGLDPELYNVSLLETKRREAAAGFLSKKGLDPKEAGALDAWLTYLYLKYASDLADGLSDLAHADPNWQIKPEKFDPAALLEQALSTNAIEQSLRSLRPAAPQYQSLQKALAAHREQAAKGGWPKLPATLRLKPGQRSPHLLALATRLTLSRDYHGAVPAAGSAVYSAELQEAVKRFQRRHGLTTDGVLGAGVVAELNVPIERRIQQLELNLERWRWLPRNLGDRYILVNIPEYRLEVWERGQVPLAMRVVVGREDTPTPIFADEMTYLVFSPFWNVPPDIAKNETLPGLLQDEGFLTRTNMEIVDASGSVVDPDSIDLSDPTRYRFRQRPGADNSLGLVKFMFPNQHNVYLHDTPADSLFDRAGRSLSHGCVRVEDPTALAAYVLRDQPEWTREQIEAAMHAGEERTVKLRTSLPVYLGYWTARAAPDGLVQFTRDVYGIDRQQRAMLAERLARQRKTAAAAAQASTVGRPTPHF